MIRNMLTAAVGTAALIAATPSLAAPGGGGSGRGDRVDRGAVTRSDIGNRIDSLGLSTGRNMGILNGEASRISDRINNESVSGATRINNQQSFDATRINRQNSQLARQLEGEQGSMAFLHASPRAISRANPNSILARGALPSSLFPGLTTGLTVEASSGATLGTVTSVLTTRNGMIAGVIVTSPNGQTYRLPASSLSVSGNVVTANTTETFERSGVPSALLPGLTTGLTVDTSTGTSLGTVSQVVTDRNGNIVGVIVTASNGQSYQLPASSLSVSGNMVTANTSEAFEYMGMPRSLLPGLTTGLAVDTAAGSAFGTVSQVNVGANGNITSVVVTAANGQKIVVPASTLSISGNVVTVANTSEAFEGTGVPSAFLPDLSTGLTVDSSAGTSIGTVSRVIASDNGNISGIVVTSANGQMFVLPASDLSMSGNTVTIASLGS